MCKNNANNQMMMSRIKNPSSYERGFNSKIHSSNNNSCFKANNFSGEVSTEIYYYVTSHVTDEKRGLKISPNSKRKWRSIIIFLVKIALKNCERS